MGSIKLGDIEYVYSDRKGGVHMESECENAKGVIWLINQNYSCVDSNGIRHVRLVGLNRMQASSFVLEIFSALWYTQNVL